MFYRRALACSLAVISVVSLVGVTVPAGAAVKAESYTNCTALNKVYPHGVARKGAKDKTSSKSSKPVTNFTVSSKVYSYNDGQAKHKGEHDLDRDNDGVACEKH